MKGQGVITGVIVAVVAAIVVAVLHGAGILDRAESVGGGLRHGSSDSGGSSTPPLVSSEPPAPSSTVRVEANDAVDLLDAYSKAAGRRDYETAYSILTPTRQLAFPRDDFDRFWNGIARTGFFPDDQPSIEKVVWLEDGAVVITVRLFFDECKKQTRSVEDVTVVVERHGGDLRLGGYSSIQNKRLTGDPVSPDVLANNCPS